MVARLPHSAFDVKSVVVISYRGISRNGRSHEFELVLLPLDGGVENPRCLGAVIAAERPFWLGADPIVEAQIESVRVVDPDREPIFLRNRPAIAVPALAPTQSALAQGPAAAAGSAISSCSKAAARNKRITTKLDRSAYRLLTRFAVFSGQSSANTRNRLNRAMAVMRSAAIDHAPSRAERRNFQRVRVKIYGRFMLEDRTEHPCQVVDMSPGNVAFRADRIGEPGEKVIAYIDHIGRVEGVVTRTLDDGFAMTVIASERKKDKLAAQLTWLANKHELDLPEDRRHERVAPRNPMSMLKLVRRPPVSVPHHRPFAFRRRRRDRRQAGARHPGHARHHARPGRAPLRGRRGDRIRGRPARRDARRRVQRRRPRLTRRPRPPFREPDAVSRRHAAGVTPAGVPLSRSLRRG